MLLNRTTFSHPHLFLQLPSEGRLVVEILYRYFSAEQAVRTLSSEILHWFCPSPPEGMCMVNLCHQVAPLCGAASRGHCEPWFPASIISLGLDTTHGVLMDQCRCSSEHVLLCGGVRKVLSGQAINCVYIVQ